MKMFTRLMVFAFAFNLSFGAYAASMKNTQAEFLCDSVALEVATYIDKIGWGEVVKEPLKINQLESRKIDGKKNPIELIKVQSTVSGLEYSVSIEYFATQDACVVLAVETR